MNRILIDMTDICIGNMLMSVPLYTLRLVDAIPSSETYRYSFLIYPEMEDFFKEKYPQFNLLIWKHHNTIGKLPFFGRRYLSKSYKKIVDNGRHDVVLVTSDMTVYTNVKLTNKKKVIVIHDQKGITESIDSTPARQKYLYNFYHKHVINADIVVAISSYTKEEIVRLHNIAPDKIKVIPNSVREVSLSSKPQIELPSNYILHVNTLQTYKNPLTLLKAFNEIKDKVDYSLVFVGKRTYYWNNELMDYIKENGFSDRVTLLQDISNEELKYCYENSRLFVTCSKREGFGYTPIEAFIYKCPVISSTCEALPEITQGRAKYYEPVEDYMKLASLIKQEFEHPTDEDVLEDNSKYFKMIYSPEAQLGSFEKIFSSL